MAEGRAEDAVGHAERAVALLEEAGNTTTTRYTSALSNLGTAYAAAERRPEAVRTHRKVVEVSERIGRGRTIGVVVALSNEAVTAWPLGWWVQAERALVKALDIAHGLDSSGAPPPYLSLSSGRVLTSLGRLDEAEASLTRMRDDPKAAARWTWAARLELVDIWLARSDLSHAAAELSSVEEHVGQEIPTTSAARVRLQRIRLIYGQGDRADARRHLQEALDQEGYPGRISPSVHMLLEFGARLALEAHESGEAERLARASISACERYAGTKEPSAFAGHEHLTLGLVLADMGRTVDARAELHRAATEIEQSAGASHPWVQEARSEIATLAASR
jgi:tetratricopeptide (TPR) repeat protein